MTVQIRIGDEEGEHSLHRCAYQPLFIKANSGKEAEKLALVHPDVISALTPYFDEAVVVSKRKVPQSILTH